MTIKDIFNTYKQGLSLLYDTNEVEALTLMIISEITSLTKAHVKAFPEKEITHAQVKQLGEILVKMKTGEPVQYILGHTEFYGLPFKVNTSVLIPRPETEELVEWIVSEIKDRPSAARILDIGTGSGCIAVSLKKSLPNTQVSAIDISTCALQTARQNADINEVNIDFINADILALVNEPLLSVCYAVIVSNPPYVTMLDKSQMHTNVTNFEPHKALFVPDSDPLIFYRTIADYAVKTLEANGFLFLEINESYGQQTVELLEDKLFTNIVLRKDLAGKDRMIKATFG